MRRMLESCTVTLCLALATLALPAEAGGGTLKGRLAFPLPRHRAGAPIPAEVTLDWSGPGLLEGRLEVALVAGDQVARRWQGDPITMAPGRQTWKVTLPGLGARQAGGPVEARLAFLGPGKRTELGSVTLPAVPFGRRVLVVLAARPAAGMDPAHEAALDRLRLDAYRPEAKPGGGAAPATLLDGYLTVIVRVPVEELPATPLAWCSYDVAFLAGDAFRQARDGALDALARWVLGGGSLALAPGRELEPRHLRFLERLVPRLDLAARPDAGPWLVHAGVGRVAVLPPPGAARARGHERDVAIFLWRVHHAHRADFDRLGESWPDVWPFETGEAWVMEASAGKLVPDRIRPLPLWVVAAIYLGFLLVVGPGEWILLGRLRRRKLTWVLFPLFALGVTLLIVRLFESHLRGSGREAAIVVHDVGPDGQVVRTQRLELVFSGSARELATRREAALAVPVPRVDDPWGLGRGSGTPEEEPPALWRGGFPGRWELVRPVRKWTPHFARSLSFEPQTIPRVGLDGLSFGRLARSWTRNGARAVLGTAGSPAGGATLYLLHEGQVEVLAGTAELLSGDALELICQGTFSQRQVRGRNWVRLGGATMEGRPQALRVAASPSCSEALDDLPVLDWTDPKQWLLVTVARRGDDIHVWRRLFVEESPR